MYFLKIVSVILLLFLLVSCGEKGIEDFKKEEGVKNFKKELKDNVANKLANEKYINNYKEKISIK